MSKQIFKTNTSSASRLLFFCLLCFALIAADQRYSWVSAARGYFMDMSAPVYWVADLPGRLVSLVDNLTRSRDDLADENARLQAESLVLQAKVQKLAALAAENVRLRELLNSSAILQDNVLAAEIIGLSPERKHQFVVLDKGSRDNVFVGQPVIDAYGLFGQVIEVGTSSSRVLLIADATHAVPVVVNRSGVRSIAEGTGRLNELTLRYVSATTDIKEGDMLVSSGLGGRFPVGYPVGQVSSVVHDPGETFVVVKAVPSAQLDRSRHVLLVFTAKPEVNSGAEPEVGSDSSGGAAKP